MIDQETIKNDALGIKSLPKSVHEKKLKDELFRIFKAVLFGVGIEKSISDVGLLRKVCNGPRTFKVIARFLMFRWPHGVERQKTTLDFNGNPHLKYVYDYTVKMDSSQITTGSGRRAERYYQIISLPPRELSKENILIIGGKNVVELFIAWIYGFKWKNIYAIDLFSLHPKIKIMDMEDIKYPDGYFNNVAMANVYGYQIDPEKCLIEISRILKVGGMLCFNSTFDSTSLLPVYRLKVKQMLQIFDRCNFEVIYHTYENKEKNVSHIWSLRKKDFDDLSLDPIG